MGMVWVMARASDEEAAALRSDPASIDDFVNSIEAYDSGRAIDLDKQWHGVHFMLTGSAGATNSPLSLIIGGFEEVGPDNGYGAAWFVPKASIAKFDRALAIVTDEQLAAQYDPAAMVDEQVYLADMFQEEGAEALQFLLEDIARLRTFVAEAAASGDNAFALIT